MKKLHAICTENCMQFFLFLSFYLYICSVNDSFLLAPWGAVTLLLEKFPIAKRSKSPKNSLTMSGNLRLLTIPLKIKIK